MTHVQRVVDGFIVALLITLVIIGLASFMHVLTFQIVLWTGLAFGAFYLLGYSLEKVERIWR